MNSFWQYDLGRRAGLLDQAPYTNPFPSGIQRNDWLEGWKQGQAELKKAPVDAGA